MSEGAINRSISLYDYKTYKH